MNQNSGGESRATAAAGALLTIWHARYRRALETYFRRRGVMPIDCEDLTQDVFVRLANHSGLNDVREAERYLFRTAANVLTDWHRRRAVRHEGMHQTADVELPDPGFTPDRVILGKDALSRLHSALAGLPEKTARIFGMYHFECLKYAEIAVELGIAVRTVEDHMARANIMLLASVDYP